MIRIIQNLYKWVSRMMGIIDSCFSLPFFLPFCINKRTLSERGGLYLFFPNGFVWFSIYLYLLHALLLAVGVTDADVPKWFAPLSNDPSAHFGTFFFIVFFPLMAFYIYINQMGLWDKQAFKQHFAEHAPTKEELRQAAEERRKQKEKRTRLVKYFKKRFLWSFSILFSFFVLANMGAEGATPWLEVFFISLASSVMLALPLAALAEQRREAKARLSKKISSE